MNDKCIHDRDRSCDQCRLENLTDEALLVEVEAYATSLVKHDIIPRGWWIELAKRLRARIT